LIKYIPLIPDDSDQCVETWSICDHGQKETGSCDIYDTFPDFFDECEIDVTCKATEKCQPDCKCSQECPDKCIHSGFDQTCTAEWEFCINGEIVPESCSVNKYTVIDSKNECLVDIQCTDFPECLPENQCECSDLCKDSCILENFGAKCVTEWISCENSQKIENSCSEGEFANIGQECEADTVACKPLEECLPEPDCECPNGCPNNCFSPDLDEKTCLLEYKICDNGKIEEKVCNKGEFLVPSDDVCAEMTCGKYPECSPECICQNDCENSCVLEDFVGEICATGWTSCDNGFVQEKVCADGQFANIGLECDDVICEIIEECLPEPECSCQSECENSCVLEDFVGQICVTEWSSCENGVVDANVCSDGEFANIEKVRDFFESNFKIFVVFV
jgi:hypothetical protein